MIGRLSLVVLVALAVTVCRADSKLVAKVKAGEVILNCHLESGYQDIPKEKVKRLTDGVWYFTNGHSKSCTMRTKGTSNEIHSNDRH